MNYTDANAKLTGRCKESRKVGRNTYLKRRPNNAIALRFHNTDILTFYKNGRIEVATGGWNTITTRQRINQFLPGGQGVHSENGTAVLCTQKSKRILKGIAKILPNGFISGGGDYAKWLKASRKERAEARRPINRGRYWFRKARGIAINRAGCTATRKWDCKAHGNWGRRQALRAFEEIDADTMPLTCGCIVQYNQPSAKGLTVAGIFAEENATVKAAQIQIYGTEKFFLDANPKILETLDTYQLLEIEIRATREHWQRPETLRALKMTCSTTGAVHIHAVPENEVSTVAQALNWIYQVPDYLGAIGQQA